MSKEDIFAAVMSGDFSSLELGDEEAFVLLRRHNFIEVDHSLALMSNHMPESDTEIPCRVKTDFKLGMPHKVGQAIYFNFPEGWNSQAFRDTYSTDLDLYYSLEEMDMEHYAYEQSELGKFEEEYNKKQWRRNRDE